jgi:hydroxylamine dehydrogenase
MERRLPKLIIAVIAAAGIAGMGAEAAVAQQSNFPKAKEFRIERSMPPEATACIECHRSTTPGIFADWAHSRHANANITCLDCHLVQPGDEDLDKVHEKYYNRPDLPYGKAEYKVPIAAIVTPKDCSRCHPDEVTQYTRSKHANTLEIIWKIDPWLNKGMNSDTERKAGCFTCHGTIIKTDAKGALDPATWPNVGVGRINMDGSKGSCTSCHTRHRFSVGEARRPEACGQCHLGPDHPQIEIYNESKHGALYQAYKQEYNFDAAGGTWTAGVDYRAPTCAVCHMSGAGKVLTSHDVTERLSWETQAPLTIRPADFKPFPAGTDWKAERGKMKAVCQQCHGDSWIEDFYQTFDKVVEEYNQVYFTPAKKMLDDLYDKGLLDKTKFFDEHLEIQFYELWHHEGRRARMGAMMMAPDYSWWHGFYECKKRLNEFIEEADKLIKSDEKAHVYRDYPNATGDTTRPAVLFGDKK